MAKFFCIAAGVVAGALGGALVVLLIAFTLYSGLGHWNSTQAFLIFVGMVVAAVFGAALGALAGNHVAEGRMHRAANILTGAMGTVAVLTLLAAAGGWAFQRMPRYDPAEQQKKQWARAMGPVDPTGGFQLAHSLLGCHSMSAALTPDALARNGCSYELSFLLGTSVTTGPSAPSFDRHDNGWRWESVKGPRGDKVVVRPDPLLEQPGPIFEFDHERLLVRRAAAGAPAFAIDTPIPAVEAYRQCLLASGSDGCAHLEKERGRLETRVMGPTPSHQIGLLSPDTSHLLIRLFPRGRYKETQFELHIAARGRVYMFQEGGGWHVTNDRNTGIATAHDPPPEPCEVNPAVPCAIDAPRGAHAAPEALYQRIAARIGSAVRADPRDRVIVRFDPQTMPSLARAVKADLRAQRVDFIPYGAVGNFDKRLAGAVAYVWLPTSIPTPGDQLAALRRWTDQGGPRREIHVHWMEGTLDLDGRQTAQPAGMDERYIAAAEIDTLEMRQRMDRAISALAASEVRVTTPAGTDIRFRTGDRPFNRQVGQFGPGKIRIDRHIEVPPGVVRVAPLETSVDGVIALPSFWIREGVRATDVKLEFTNGRITRASARERQGELDNYLRSQPALNHFREFCLGFNPQLAMKPGEMVIPYYGYGAGVVRMSLGDNEELGGTVRGGAVRWNFFVDATVMAGDLVIVKAGRLMLQ